MLIRRQVPKYIDFFQMPQSIFGTLKDSPCLFDGIDLISGSLLDLDDLAKGPFAERLQRNETFIKNVFVSLHGDTRSRLTMIKSSHGFEQSELRKRLSSYRGYRLCVGMNGFQSIQWALFRFGCEKGCRCRSSLSLGGRCCRATDSRVC